MQDGKGLSKDHSIGIDREGKYSMVIKPGVLTLEVFKEYGHILNLSQGEPLASNEEITYWGKITELKMSQVISTGILYAHKRECTINSFERHVNTPEILVALEGDSIICFCKPSVSNISIDLNDARAFYIRQGDVIAMHPGTWHWAGFPQNCESSKFLVLFASGTEANDLEVRDLSEAIKILKS